jgi:curved DNA-binding protein CbpA
MENRRNYYRILEVQPDAPFEVIRHNYMLLLHKLRLHPDLGGSHRDAALINIAFETLSDPEKRAAYDRKLLRDHDIVTLSMGHLKRPGLFSRYANRREAASDAEPYQNRRNFYRLLGVQPDAHAAVIRERCQALLRESSIPHGLLHEAYVILNNAKKRAEYDRLLKNHGHSEAIRRMRKQDPDRLSSTEPRRSARSRTAPPPELQNYAQYPKILREAFYEQPDEPDFEPMIRHYCYFCKTPHNYDPRIDREKLCPVCASPLFSATADMSGKTRRALLRVKKTGPIVFYVYWPGRELGGRLFDISPNGLGFYTEYGLDMGQIIKIDGEKFKAVGEVVHTRVEADQTSSGIHFRTVAFSSPKGNFIAASA